MLCDFQKAKLAEAESFSHLGMQKSPAGTVRLYPFAIDHKLGDGPLAHVAKHFVRRAWSRLNVDFSEGNLVVFEKALRFPAITAPWR